MSLLQRSYYPIRLDVIIPSLYNIQNLTTCLPNIESPISILSRYFFEKMFLSAFHDILSRFGYYHFIFLFSHVEKLYKINSKLPMLVRVTKFGGGLE